MVVIDVLRATTTIAAILHHGGSAVLPVADLDAARQAGRSLPGALLGGERENRRPEGFDAGNSPMDFPADRVMNRPVVLTTTNGTRAIERCSAVDWLACAALVNATIVGEALWETASERALVVCAGARGRPALEDVLAAGAVVSVWPRDLQSDNARMAHLVYRQFADDLYRGLLTARHGEELHQMGFDQDLRYASRLDACPVLPRLNSDGWIRPES